jgi:hypothetical protein
MNRLTRILIGAFAIAAILAAGVRLIRFGTSEAVAPFVQKPQEVGERVTIKEHACSLRVPRGWIERDVPSGGTMFFAPEDSGYIANLIVMSEPFKGELREFADTNMAGAREALPAAKFATDIDFATESGAPAFKATISNKKPGLDLTQAMYFFEGPAGRKIGVTTTSLAADEPEMQLLFDTCLKSLAVLAP